MSQNNTVPGWRKALVTIMIISSALLLVILIIQFIVNGFRKLYYSATAGESNGITYEYASDQPFDQMNDDLTRMIG